MPIMKEVKIYHFMRFIAKPYIYCSQRGIFSFFKLLFWRLKVPTRAKMQFWTKNIFFTLFLCSSHTCTSSCVWYSRDVDDAIFSIFFHFFVFVSCSCRKNILQELFYGQPDKRRYPTKKRSYFNCIKREKSCYLFYATIE